MSDRRDPGARLATWLVAGAALVLLAPAPAAAQRRAPIVQSLELAVLQPPTVVPVGGARHLVYELHLTNLGAADVVLTRVEVVDAERPPAVVGDLQEAVLQAALGRPGITSALADTREIGGGLRAVLYLWIPLGDAVAPATVTHRISFDVIRTTGREHHVMQGGRTGVRRDPPVALGAPLQGGRWVALYGPSTDRGHRRFLYTIDGRARIPARFAIDWMKLGDDDTFAPGDRTAIASWYGYGANVLAVADATVAEAKDDVVEDTAISNHPAAIALENASGNYIALALGGGRYAFYEHLKHGSIGVKRGDRVRRGQVIGLLGNTGSSSSGPHLHFHVSDVNASLGAEGLPYVFDAFEVVGRFQNEAGSGSPAVVPLANGVIARRRRDMPEPSAVVRF